MSRGRFLVDMVKERDKENISPSLLTQYENNQPNTRLLEQECEQIAQESVLVNRPQLEDDLTMSSSNEASPTKTRADLSVVENNSIPGTPKNQQTGKPKYYISPIRSDESDIDDSDEDPNFRLIHKSKKPCKVVPPSPSLSSSNTSTCSSGSSTCSSSSLGTEDDSAMVAEGNAQKPVIEEKKGKKRVRKPTTWKT